MGRIVVMNHVTLDGVMQGPGRADEDTRDGFTQGGWASRSVTPDDATGKTMGERMAAGGGLAGWLFGRWTYQSLLATLNDRGGPFKDALNSTPKYVASTTLTEPLPSPHSTLLRGDVAPALLEGEARGAHRRGHVLGTRVRDLRDHLVRGRVAYVEGPAGRGLDPRPRETRIRNSRGAETSF